MTKATDYAATLLAKSHEEHAGVFICGPSEIEMQIDNLPESSFDDSHIITASLGNCRCASDQKAIKQFTGHARVPNDADRVALGHETIQMVLQAPDSAPVKAGDLVFVTPGHAADKVNPQTFEADPENGILPSLGYSYRYMGGLRQYNAIPTKAIQVVKDQGFGNLLNTVSREHNISLASLAHAEPFACNYGTNKFIVTEDGNGGFIYGVPPRARLAYLGGTARMAMINLTIVASVPEDELPKIIHITGSQSKLDELNEFALIKRLRDQGVVINLIDRRDPDIVGKILEYGPVDVVWTNFAGQDIYEQAVGIIADGGNINNYAGAADPSLTLDMQVKAAETFTSLAEEATAQCQAMHHNVHANDPEHYFGLSKEGDVLLVGFSDERAAAYTKVCANKNITAIAQGSEVDKDSRYADVFIAGTDESATADYAAIEEQLARNSAVNFVDGNCTIKINSRFAHYTSRHYICGSNVPWRMTNTSEPHADDMNLHGQNPVDFDWMVKGIVGIKNATTMMHDVEASAPFGSFFTFTELEDLPWVEIDATALRAAADAADAEHISNALNSAADVLDKNGNCYSREVENALYAAYNKPHPLALS